MAGYSCPRCGEAEVERSSGGAVAGHFGLVGALIGMAFAKFECKKCGEIPKSEFSADARSQMSRNSAFMVLGAVAFLGR